MNGNERMDGWRTLFSILVQICPEQKLHDIKPSKMLCEQGSQ